MRIMGRCFAGFKEITHGNNGGFRWAVHVDGAAVPASELANAFERMPIRFFSAYQQHTQRIEYKAARSQYLYFRRRGMKHRDVVLMDQPLSLQMRFLRHQIERSAGRKRDYGFPHPPIKTKGQILKDPVFGI